MDLISSSLVKVTFVSSVLIPNLPLMKLPIKTRKGRLAGPPFNIYCF